MKVKTVTAAVPSPDGRLAAWTETHPVMEGEKSEAVTQVFLARSDGSNRLQLTRGEKSSNAPAFSPDSAWVFFASDRSGKRNIYRIPVDGGEAEMLTSWSGTLGAYAVSPDGKWIAFTAREPDTQDEGEVDGHQDEVDRTQIQPQGFRRQVHGPSLPSHVTRSRRLDHRPAETTGSEPAT